MNKLYSWAMRNSGQILFGLAVLIFAIGVWKAFIDLRGSAVDTSIEGAPVSQRGFGLWMAVAGMLNAANLAVWPLAAAAALYRWDRHSKIRE